MLYSNSPPIASCGETCIKLKGFDAGLNDDVGPDISRAGNIDT
ncbi:MAG: hypothetical protein WD187_03145 [Candidatus Woykebacteria bacterium]